MKIKEQTKSGVYGIYETLKGNVIYIGSSGNLIERYNRHKTDLKNNIHKNSKLQEFCNYYGFENLEFRFLFYCDEDELLYREFQMINLLSPPANSIINIKTKQKKIKIDSSAVIIKRYIDSHKLKTTEIQKRIFDDTELMFSLKKIGVVLQDEGYKSFQDSTGARFHIKKDDSYLGRDMKEILFGELKYIDKIYISDIISRLDYNPKSHEVVDFFNVFGYKSNKGEDGKIYYSKK